MSQATSSQDFKIDIKKWGWKIVSHWWLFLIGLGITIPAGQAYLRYSTPKYQTRAMLLIKGVKGASALSELSILSDGLGLGDGGKELTNEIEILRSRPILTKVVEKLGIDITYYRQGVFRNTELYQDTPVLVSEYKLTDRERLTFYIKMGYYQDFEFRIREDEEGETHNFGEPFENQFGRFLITQNKTAKLIPGDYQVNIMQSENVANSYKGALVIEAASSAKRGSSILELKLIDATPTKAKNVLNTLMDVYNKEEIADNVVIFENTVSFVNDRISRLSNELDSIESNIESFKSANNIITETASSSLGFSLAELRQALSNLTAIELERELLLALKSNLVQEPESLIPTNVSGDAPILSGLIDRYNELFIKRKKLANTVSVENPLYIQNTVELNDLRDLINQSLENLLDNLEIPAANAKKEIRQLRTDLNAVPSVEKRLIEKLRLQSIKENLYLFLLQKKEETELSLAITRANTRIIEPARSGGSAVFPNKKTTRLASGLLGLLMPVLIIILIDLLKTTANDEDTVKSHTTVPIIGRIPHYKKNEGILLKPGERSIRAEMFKLLRTNLNFTNLDRKDQVFVVTSSTSGEGKSVTAINLGITISLSNKKVVVLDMDLRKPKIARYLELNQPLGVTNYLIGESGLSELMVCLPDYPNLSFIASGPVPPNPTEMIMSERTGLMIEELKKEFDYIIIDCPPIGVVTDGLLLRSYLTNMLYVVRHKKTKKESLREMEDMHKKGELVNPSIVINDISVDGRNKAYGGYSAGYGYGYYINK